LKASMLEHLKKEAGETEDTLVGQAMLAIFSTKFDEFALDTMQHSIKISFMPDTIWQYHIGNNNSVGDYFRIDPITGKSWHFTNTNFTKPNHDFIGYYKSGNVTIDKKDRKQIRGFDCYKVVYELETKTDDDENFKINDGNTIYEMYVTEQIALPIHALFITHELLNTFFPLEIIKYQKNLKGIKESYSITEFIQIK